MKFLYNYFESGRMVHMLCREFYLFSSDGRFDRQSRTGWASLSDGLLRNICVKLF